MDKNTNSLNWFEIPTTDIARARKFYETIFNIKMEEMPMPQLKMVSFPADMGSGKANGALVQHEMYSPSDKGVVIYLNANPKIQDVIDRIESAGGKIVIPKTQISPEIGYMAFFTDTEGNRLALHAQN
jgi:predicted enzyme related to lactoylglutathione lyase